MSLETLAELGWLAQMPTQEQIDEVGPDPADYDLLMQWWAAPSDAEITKDFNPDEPREDNGRWTSGGNLPPGAVRLKDWHAVPSLPPGAVRLKDFNPDEPRDEHGRWSGGGGASTASGSQGLHSMFDRVGKPDGGFTYQPMSEHEPSTGFAVSPYPERSFGVDSDKFKFQDLVTYAAKNQDLFQKPDHYIGAWHDPASHRIFLDVSVVSSNAHEAEALARKHDQIAYFDLGAGKSVTVNPDATSGGAAKSVRASRPVTPQGAGPDPDRRASRSALREADRQEADRAGAPGGARGTREVTLSADELRTAALLRALIPDLAEREFDPNEPRDEHGRWTSGGGGASSGSGGGSTGGGRESSSPMPQRVNPSVIPRAPELSPEQRAIETRFAEQLAADPRGAWERYKALADTKGGKVLAVDVARELSPDYMKDRSQSAAVHEPSSWFIKQAYAQELARPPGPGERPEVLFMAGGTGAGKTTAIRAASASMLDQAQLIYDSNLAGFASSRGKIDQAVAAGKDVIVVNVDRDPLTAFTAGLFPDGPKGSGVLMRAMENGRTVPLEAHIDTHVKSRETVPELEKAFASNKHVQFQYINNNFSGPKSAKRVASFADLPKPDLSSLRGNLHAALERAHKEHRISDAVYAATLHANAGH